ncbi:potassium voltage-gated channel protein Shaw [Octopus bimaculoides]|uniref:potassium voltage-gated channel protein Shaw n=1 Tax=Octopus bimaculoides TaxID=37653 RepID=UPI00071D299B|nr:potassium voltage-gated channel protein Shaw [Octopus bimaculoides]|eukprot:XP_014773845.1 PREDICTED: potassium voltage-gated channel protein Shaw-like [Octopus bimaculoides]
MDRSTIRVVYECEFRRGTNSSQMFLNINEVFNDDVASEHTVCRWFEKFRSGDSILENQPNGRPETKIENDGLETVMEADISQTLRKKLTPFCIVYLTPVTVTVWFIRSGELHVPLDVCGAVVKRELDFWEIDEFEIKACCWRHYRSYIDNQRILNDFNQSLQSERFNVNYDNLKGWKKLQMQVWLILDHPRTSRPAMIYGITSFLFVVLSILGFCLETLPQVRGPTNITRQCNGETSESLQVMQSHDALNVIDVICTIFFTLELIARFIFAPQKLKFVRSLMNIIDLLALVPLYVQVILHSTDPEFCYLNERLVMEIMFILRIIRMFRIFHLVKHYQALKILVYAMKASIQELLMLAIFMIIAMLVFATMIYYAERKDATNASDAFNTIPMGFWWAIITMTTVGYGDVYPSSTIGYIVGAGCALSGVLLVALTIPVISNNFTLFYTHVRSRSSERRVSRTFQGGSEILEHHDPTNNFDRRSSNSSVVLETFMNGTVAVHKMNNPLYATLPYADRTSISDNGMEDDMDSDRTISRNGSFRTLDLTEPKPETRL